MTNEEPGQEQPFRRYAHLGGRLAYSRFGGWIATKPPFSWIIRWVTRQVVRKKLMGAHAHTGGTAHTGAQAHTGASAFDDAGMPIVPPERNIRAGLQSSLQAIVRDIVEALGYAGAMIAAYEQGDVLPVQATYFDPTIATLDQIREWETLVSDPGHPLSLTDQNIARVYLHRSEYRNNLSARAARAGGPVKSSQLFDLFTPIAPDASREIVRGIQEAVGIREVIALPFFLDTESDGQVTREYLGNLFVLKRAEITDRDVCILSAFAHQVAASILSERRRMLADSIQRLVLDMQRKMANEEPVVEQRRLPRDGKKAEGHSLGRSPGHPPSVEEKILNRIARGIVEDLGYTGAMVATLETDDVLPVRAVYVNPELASMDRIRYWEKQVAKFGDHPLSLTDPDVALVFVKRPEYRENLSVKAVNARKPVTSDDLFHLFTPIAPEASREVVRGIQQALGIRQVIAVPFFLDERCVGNLFAATQSAKFTRWEIEQLQAFGNQAAVGLYNARLYQQSEDRRDASMILARMAFTASALVHAFRSHLSVVRGNLQLIQYAQDDQQRRELVERQGKVMMNRLDKIADILSTLHAPFVEIENMIVRVNPCLERALDKVSRDLDTRAVILRQQSSIPSTEDPGPDTFPILVFENKAHDLPCVSTSPEMLTEAFRVLIKNAIESMIEKENSAKTRGQSRLWIESCLASDHTIVVTVRDNGAGIRPENLSKVFDMRWTTKAGGLGFGLFWTRDYVEAQLKGRIELESIWQEGTAFHLYLPAANEPQE